MEQQKKAYNPEMVLKDTHEKVLKRFQRKFGDNDLKHLANILNQEIYHSESTKYKDELDKVFSAKNFAVKKPLELKSRWTAESKQKFMDQLNKGEKLFEALQTRLKQSTEEGHKILQKILENPRDYKNYYGQFSELRKELEKNVLSFLSKKEIRSLYGATESTESSELDKLEEKIKNLNKNKNIGFLQYCYILNDFFAQKTLNSPNQLAKGQAFENMINSIANTRINDIFNKESGKMIANVVGGETVPMGKKDGFSITEDKEGEKIYSFEAGGFKIEIKDTEFNPYTERDQKTDILIKSENDSKGMGISAKNWRDFKYYSRNKKRDEYAGFSANFIYSMIRILGIENTIDWKNGIFAQLENKGGSIYFYAHKLAQYVITVDAIMGYAQENGYADVVVINNYTKQKIYVFSIKQMLKNIHKNISNFKVENYDPKKINNIVKEQDNSKFLVNMKQEIGTITVTIKDIQKRIQVYSEDGKSGPLEI